MLHLVKNWLTVPVEETDEKGKKRLTGGRDNDRGTPQGGVISPLLANLFCEPDVEGMEADGAWRAVSGADSERRG
jgi:RNA-directed DNA polymerase